MKNIYKELLYKGTIIEYKSNEMVFNEHDLCEKIGIIVNGKIKISTFSNNGNEITINLLEKDDCFGDLLLFSSNPYYYGFAIALSNTSICYISKNVIVEAMMTNQQFLNDFLRSITDKGVLLKQKNKLFAYKNIEERITYYLYHYLKRDENDYIYYKSITDIASFLSLPRPSLSRSLHKMEKENKIIIEKNKIKLL